MENKKKNVENDVRISFTCCAFEYHHHYRQSNKIKWQASLNFYKRINILAYTRTHELTHKHTSIQLNFKCLLINDITNDLYIEIKLTFFFASIK